MENGKDQPNSKIRWLAEFWWLSSSLSFTIALKGIWTTNCQAIMYILRVTLNLKRYYGWFTKITFNKDSFIENSWRYFTRNVKRRTPLSVYSDYSKAFDTVQDDTIIQNLHKIGFSTSALKWFISYLGNRSQYVQVNYSKSATKSRRFGVCKSLYWAHSYLIST